MLSSINDKSASIFRSIPESIILFIARFAIAAVFWKSGQTKIEGFTLDFIAMKMELGVPKLAASTGYLFENEYNLPLIPPMIAAVLASTAEHILPILILSGLFTRLAAFGIAGMTLVIQVFVYPEAYAVHATWLSIALLLMYRGAGSLSLDNWLVKR